MTAVSFLVHAQCLDEVKQLCWNRPSRLSVDDGIWAAVSPCSTHHSLAWLWPAHHRYEAGILTYIISTLMSVRPSFLEDGPDLVNLASHWWKVKEGRINSTTSLLVKMLWRVSHRFLATIAFGADLKSLNSPQLSGRWTILCREVNEWNKQDVRMLYILCEIFLLFLTCPNNSSVMK